MQVFSLKRYHLIIGLIVIISGFCAGLTMGMGGAKTCTSNAQRVVVVDAGHGSVDSGACFENLEEKHINLQVALFVKELLEQSNIKVVMTRTDDSLYNQSRNDDLIHRVKITNDVNPDCFVSIHVNKFPTSEPFGGQAYYFAGEASKLLAEKIQHELKSIQPENYRSIGTGNYLVLKRTRCPAVIVEIGFISNPGDRERITNRDEQYRIAKAIRNGVVNYLNNPNPVAPGKENPGVRTNQNASATTPDDTNWNNNTATSGSTDTIPTSAPKNTDLSKGYNLYFAQTTAEGENLIPVHQALPIDQIITVHNDANMTYIERVARGAVLALIAGPNDARLASVIAPGSKLLSLKVENGLATVNFNKAFSTNHWGSAETEELTVRSLVQTLTALPDIDRVQILIEGKTVQTLKGHVAIDQPLTADSVK